MRLLRFQIFFTKTNGYNAFILHYAQLTTGYVHAFAIGSELKALTAVTSSVGVFPTVTQLINLASTVQGVMPFAKVTYAADWSEYHHTDRGWYHLDPLWASPHIDFIGIDAYFPLTDGPQNAIDKQTIRDGWTSGEGYDWYYSDVARTTKATLQPQFAWKNIAWWWNNVHVNPNAVQTACVYSANTFASALCACAYFGAAHSGRRYFDYVGKAHAPKWAVAR